MCRWVYVIENNNFRRIPITASLLTFRKAEHMTLSSAFVNPPPFLRCSLRQQLFCLFLSLEYQHCYLYPWFLQLQFHCSCSLVHFHHPHYSLGAEGMQLGDMPIHHFEKKNILSLGIFSRLSIGHKIMVIVPLASMPKSKISVVHPTKHLDKWSACNSLCIQTTCK